MKLKKERLDVLVHARGLAETRSLAQRLIMAGRVRVADQVIIKPSHMVDPALPVTLEAGEQYVSRGGEKLKAALSAFDMQDLSGWVCVDIGASTGGFTDCLLQHNARMVFSVDVGHGVLHWKLRNDPRVVVMERTNARFLSGFPQKIDLVTVDASFISLKLIVKPMVDWLETDARLITLIKPQFEAGRRDAARGEGVIRDPEVQKRVLSDLFRVMRSYNFGLMGVIRSPLLGPKGNVEFLAAWVFRRLDHIPPEDAVEGLFAVDRNVG